MLLAAWLAACVVLAYATRRHLLVTVGAALTCWVAVPVVAGSLLTGHDTGVLGAHPAAWLVLVTLGVQLLHDPRPVLDVVARRVHLVITLVLVVLVAALTTQQTGSGGLALLVDMVVAPVALFLLVLAAADGHADRLVRLRTLLLALAAGSAALAVVQWVTGSILLFEDRHATRYWFDEDFERWMGTTDHPLTLSLLLCVTAPLLVGLRRASVQLPLLALMGAGVVITQSRTGVVVIALVGVWVVLRAKVAAHVRLLSLCALTGGVAAFLASGLVEGVAARFADDTGSAGARTDAFGFFAQTWQDYLVVGHGLTSSYQVAAVGGLRTSLESSFLMYAVDIGIVFAVLYFGAQAVLVGQAWAGRESLPGARVAALVALLLPHTYSALAARSAVGTVLWFALALGAAQATPARSPERVPVGHGAVEVPLSRRTVTGEPSSA